MKLLVLLSPSNIYQSIYRISGEEVGDMSFIQKSHIRSVARDLINISHQMGDIDEVYLKGNRDFAQGILNQIANQELVLFNKNKLRLTIIE